MQNGTRVGLSCVCVCAGIHCHLAGYTATHHAVHCLRIPSLILISCIILILYNQVEGGWDTQTCSCRAGSDRGVAAAAVAVSIESLIAVFAWRDRLKMAVSCHVDVTTNRLPTPMPLFPLPSLSFLSCAATDPGTCGLGRAPPFRFRGRLHRSTWQDTYTTATNLGQISCRGI